ncbi:MAG: class I SAM-dependent methyltransferase [Pyrinomonadaceae bacterium]
MPDNTSATTNIDVLKTKLKAIWSAGDFGEIAKSYTDGAAEFVSRLPLKAGMTVLDVACGTGNTALPAARMGAVVTGVDIAPNLVEQARELAAAKGLTATFAEGDAESLDFDDASFDAVITMFGAMFAPRPNVVAAELLRVCRPGGFIAMANWTPAGFVGQMFKTVGKYAVRPPGMVPPVLWGDEATVRERFGEHLSELKMTRRMMKFAKPYPPAEVVEHFRTYFGPTQTAFEMLDADGQAALRSDLEQLWTANNQATDGTTAWESEYLEVLAIRR